ncbi:related to flagellar assembly protein (FliH) [Desulfotalea psychrophila LSv54]|uniref:Flagellar assembly protein FliH n=2 Tax=Desulfotalea psychrophila TaxID=84980 RepID=Q6AJT9_DESPS|nr:related to flagellar assembly protein (FliH) [Desulfotalea psychrophila LSv54]
MVEVAMSLSRIFKDSANFEPENLTACPVATGWQAEQTSPQKKKIFHASKKEHLESIQPGQTRAREPLAKTAPAEKEALPAPAKQSAKHLQPKISKTIAPPSPIPDNYVDRDEAAREKERAFQDGKSSGLEEGREEGRIEGIKEGKRLLKDEFSLATKALLTSCQQLDSSKANLVVNSSAALKDFAIAIAEQIIRYSVKEHDITIIATIEEALQRAIKSQDFYIYLHPDDYQIVKEKAEDLISNVSGLDHVFLKKDVKIERGGAYMESDNCIVDATIASQFEVILKELEQS